MRPGCPDLMDSTGPSTDRGADDVDPPAILVTVAAVTGDVMDTLIGLDGVYSVDVDGDTMTIRHAGVTHDTVRTALEATDVTVREVRHAGRLPTEEPEGFDWVG
jgi:hypothetical protein